nr:PREDICTED: uncharacterized protein LOC102357408 isoform X6 [Latimeria chalumnae]|eukprot:XP_014352882.1 PREDICTED: uncharacterized protein LOC102357408 isoform X6 [Latimeria chalumnae]
MTFKAFFIKQELTCCELQNIYFLVNYSLQSMLLKILTLFPVWHFLKGTFIKCVVLRSVFCVRYVEEHIQKTGVAIETQGFTFVTSGRKRESLTGNATLHLYPHFQSLQEITGVADYLSTEISTSKQKRFSLVTFIDTPGLVDGDMKYEFDVEKTLVWLGDHVDLIFVFFDPMGQALCKRTLNIVEKLNEKNGEKLRFYLSKADEAGHESDRQRVMMQIVQELCKRPGLNKCGFDMPTIYIPNPNKPSRCVNQIEEICKTIEKTINLMVQNTLNQLEEDCQTITETVDRKLIDDRDQVIINRKARIRHFLFGSLGFLLPLSFLTAFIISCLSRESLAAVTGENMADNLHFWANGPYSFQKGEEEIIRNTELCRRCYEREKGSPL